MAYVEKLGQQAFRADGSINTNGAAEYAAKLAAAEEAAIEAREKADAAEQLVQELRKAAQGSDERLARAIDGVIPRFQRLFASPEVKANPRLLKRNDWILPGYSLDMMTAAGGAVENSRRPKHWPKYAAISFVATMENRERKSVQRAYDRFHASRTN